MVATLKRQLTDEEKAVILQRFGPHCYANGHTIPDDEPVQYDHIHAHGLGGDSELNNIAPMCAQHNQQKGQLPLGDFRIKLQLDTFFASGEKQTLRHLLAFLAEQKRIAQFGCPIVAKADGDSITLDTQSGPLIYALYKCPTTGWHYFYATLNVSLLDSDDEADGRPSAALLD
jgi:hypothetical protein